MERQVAETMETNVKAGASHKGDTGLCYAVAPPAHGPHCDLPGKASGARDAQAVSKPNTVDL